MQKKIAFHTTRAAEMGGPYSQAVIYNGMIYISGQGAVDPATNQVKTGTIEAETQLALENIRLILVEAGASLDHLLHVNVYLRDIREYGRFNAAYAAFFREPLPARSCVQVKRLPFDLRVEIDAVGYL